MTRRTFFISLAFLLMLTMGAGGALAANWKMGHIRPDGMPEDLASRELADRVRELTQGKLQITVYPSSQLGDWTVVQQRISMGAVEMALQPQDSQVDKRLSILFFPYLFTSLEQVKRNMEPNSPFRKEVEALFMKQRILPLAFWPSFFGGIGLKTLPDIWDRPKASKGMKIRVPNDPSFVTNVQAMGYLATPIPFSDTFPALQTGIVDGLIGTGVVGYYSNFRDLIKYYLPLNDHLEIYTVMVSLDAYEKLDEDTRTKLRQAGSEMEKKRYQTFHTDEENYRKKLEEAGIKIMPVTDAIIAKFAEVAKKECWPELANKIDKAYIERVLSLIVQ